MPLRGRTLPATAPSDLSTLARTRVIVCCGLLAGVALSPKLWFPLQRLYPTTPVVDDLTRVSPVADCVLSVALVLVSLAAAFGLSWHRSLRLLVVLLAALAALDQSRLQPWVFLYGTLALALTFGNRRDGTTDARLNTARALVLSLYFWSGVQKLNATFVATTWSELTASMRATLPPSVASLVARSGLAIPLLEITLALALVFRPTRRAGVIAVLVMHALLCAVLAFGGDNAVVLPWNVAMAGLVVVLFAGSQASVALRLRPLLAWPQVALVALCAVMPVLSLIGRWDAYLSGALYSGNTLQGVVLVPAAALERLPEVVRRNTWQRSEPYFVDLNRWSYDELNVPAYPAERVFRRVGREVCRRDLVAGEGALRLLGPPGVLDRERAIETLACPVDPVISPAVR